jgi:hypothetical protein
LQTAQAGAAATATVLSEAARTSGIQQKAVEVSINVNADGILNGSNSARSNAVDALHQVLDKYQGCRVGFVLTTGWSGTDTDNGIGEGNELADDINAILRDDFPNLFGDTGFESIANVADPRGQVDLKMFFHLGCEQAGS